MKKLRKGDRVIATKSCSQTGDRSYMSSISEVLHKAPHHYILKGEYGKYIMTIEGAEDRQFVKATKKMIELMKKGDI